ncbi:MAG: hypothetical protein CL676_07770 [Bdellovibrionaceae bacterium]|nr:hypothetical protein [Pseudobdellovibrionaceae bacterium]
MGGLADKTTMGAPKLIHEIADIENSLREIPVFAEFPQELLSPLVNFSEFEEFKKNEEILAQGQMNENLLFLMEGEVSVFVDGGFVGKISEPGSLLGEMSVIKRSPVSATLVADSPVKLIEINTNGLLNSNAELKGLYNSVLYCMYSHVLVEKLEKTNEKAKRFEETNYRLKSAEADLKSLNENLEDQVHQRMKALEGKIGELYDQLSPLKDSSRLSPEDHGQVLHALEILNPIKSFLSSGLKLKGQRILYVDSQKKNHLSTKLSLGGTGAILDQALDWEEAKEKLSSQSYSLVIFDEEHLSHFEEAQNLQPSSFYLAVLNGFIRDQLDSVGHLQGALRFFFRSQDKKTQIQNMLSAVTKILTDQYFGLEPYMGFGAEVRSERIKSSTQRADLLEELDQYLNTAGVRKNIRERARLVADELLMNAIYDAPVDSIDRKPLFNHLPRTEEVILEPNQQGTFSFVFDGTKILMAVRDPFGALDSATIYRYLKNCYSSEPEEINAQEGKGGAGRGLHQIVEASSELIFNLSPGSKTEVISVIYAEKEDDSVEGSRIQLFST